MRKPTLVALLLGILFGAVGVVAPNNFPRTDLVAAFLTGVEGVNATATASEMLRLNTALGAPAADAQNSLGAALCFDRTATGGMLDTTNAGCDPAGFPNGRRPGDDVIDIVLRVAEGYLAPTGDAPAGELAIFAELYEFSYDSPEQLTDHAFEVDPAGNDFTNARNKDERDVRGQLVKAKADTAPTLLPALIQALWHRIQSDPRILDKARGLFRRDVAEVLGDVL